jgi:hypothetical protein
MLIEFTLFLKSTEKMNYRNRFTFINGVCVIGSNVKNAKGPFSYSKFRCWSFNSNSLIRTCSTLNNKRYKLSIIKISNNQSERIR